MLQVICQPLGPVEANCYLVVDGVRALLIDPGDDYKELKGLLASLGAHLEGVLLTHAHFDHIAGLDKVLKEFGCDVYMNPAEFDFLSDEKLNGSQYFQEYVTSNARPKPVKEGEQNIGGFEVKAWFLPGHSIGSTVYEIGNNLFTGDVLFQGSAGRIDLPTGNATQMKQSLAFLKTLPDDLIVYPGHGPSSSLGQEKMYNPFMLYNLF